MGPLSVDDDVTAAAAELRRGNPFLCIEFESPLNRWSFVCRLGGGKDLIWKSERSSSINEAFMGDIGCLDPGPGDEVICRRDKDDNGAGRLDEDGRPDKEGRSGEETLDPAESEFDRGLPWLLDFVPLPPPPPPSEAFENSDKGMPDNAAGGS